VPVGAAGGGYDRRTVGELLGHGDARDERESKFGPWVETKVHSCNTGLGRSGQSAFAGLDRVPNDCCAKMCRLEVAI